MDEPKSRPRLGVASEISVDVSIVAREGQKVVQHSTGEAFFAPLVVEVICVSWHVCHFFPGKCSTEGKRAGGNTRTQASIQAGNQVEKLQAIQTLLSLLLRLSFLQQRLCMPPFGGIWNNGGMGDAIFTVHMIFFEIGASIGR